MKKNYFSLWLILIIGCAMLWYLFASNPVNLESNNLSHLIDKNLLNQGEKGITAMKLRNVLISFAKETSEIKQEIKAVKSEIENLKTLLFTFMICFVFYLGYNFNSEK